MVGALLYFGDLSVQSEVRYTQRSMAQRKRVPLDRTSGSEPRKNRIQASVAERDRNIFYEHLRRGCGGLKSGVGRWVGSRGGGFRQRRSPGSFFREFGWELPA